MGKQGSIVALGAAATMLLLRTAGRKNKHRRRVDDDSISVSSGASSFSTSAASHMGQPTGHSRHHHQHHHLSPPLPTVGEEDVEITSHPVVVDKVMWDRVLVATLLLAALGVSVARRAWDVSGLIGGVLLVLIVSRLFRRRRRRRRKAASLTRQDSGASTQLAAPVTPAAAAGTAAHHHALLFNVQPDVRLGGVWIKDGKASDPMDTACDIMHLNGVVRMAVGLVKGVEIALRPAKPADINTAAHTALSSAAPVAAAAAAAVNTPTSVASTVTAAASGAGQGASDAAGGSGPHPSMVFEMAVFSVISWFKVRERYVINGSSSTWNRRDLRKGKHTGSCTVLGDGGLRLDLQWKPPHGGSGYDEFRLEGPDELHVTSHLDVDNRKHTYTVVYRRKK